MLPAVGLRSLRVSLDPLTSLSRACLILFFSPRHLLSSSSFFTSASNLSPPAALRPSILSPPPHRPPRQDFARIGLLLT